LSKNQVLIDIISDKLSLNTGHQSKMSGWQKKTHLDDNNMQVSRETIYKILFIQTKGVLKKSLTEHLRTKNIRSCNYKTHWEGDLISGSKNTHIATFADKLQAIVVMTIIFQNQK
jgi:IS30 family transposase